MANLSEEERRLENILRSQNNDELVEINSDGGVARPGEGDPGAALIRDPKGEY